MSSLNAGNPIKPGQTVVAVVTDATFTNAAVATLRSGSITQVQAKTFVNGTNFTLNLIVQGNLLFGPVILRVTEGATTEDIAGTLIPITDNAYTNTAAHDISADSIFFGYAPYATIQQVEYTNAALVYEVTRDKVLTQNAVIYSDGKIKWQRDIASTDIRLHDGTDWSPFETITFNSFDVVTVPTFPAVCRSSSHQTLWHKFNRGHPYKYDRSIYERPSFTTPVGGVNLLVRSVCRDPDLHTKATATTPSLDFYSVLTNGATLKLFDILKSRNDKNQVNVTFNIAANQSTITKYEYKFKFENETWTKEDPLIADRTPRDYSLAVGEFSTGPETSIGQQTVNFIEGGPPIKFDYHIINNEFVMQPFFGEAPVRNFDNWVKFKPSEWVGVVMVTRWSRYHGGWHVVYINGQKLYETTGACLPSSADVVFKLGLKASLLAWSRRSVSFKDVKITPNPVTLFP